MKIEKRPMPNGIDAGPPTPGEGEGEGEQVQPWELIDTGRYRPRRIRGSYRGRELG
jgi:hypothetical protein